MSYLSKLPTDLAQMIDEMACIPHKRWYSIVMWELEMKLQENFRGRTIKEAISAGCFKWDETSGFLRNDDLDRWEGRMKTDRDAFRGMFAGEMYFYDHVVR